MPLSLHDITIPAYLRAFRNLSSQLAKARAYADENNIPHDEILSARLYPDMLTLTGQIQRASDTAKAVPPRVAGIAAPPLADTETSFDDLEARIAATVDFLKSVPSTAFDGRDEAEVVMKFGKQEFKLTARDYVLGFALPNFYFHAATAYAIMRHKGVPIGKMDFIGLR